MLWRDEIRIVAVEHSERVEGAALENRHDAASEMPEPVIQPDAGWRLPWGDAREAPAPIVIGEALAGDDQDATALAREKAVDHPGGDALSARGGFDDEASEFV